MSSSSELESEIGQVFIQWSFPEHEKHQRGRTWYWLFGSSMLGLLVVALFTLNFFFAVIILLISTIMFFRDVRDPEQVTFMIGETGIVVGSRSYAYKELKSFWIIYEPPKVKNLYFETKSLLHPKLSIPLLDQNPLKIRDILVKRVEEDLEQEYEPFSEQVGRIFKI